MSNLLPENPIEVAREVVAGRSRSYVEAAKVLAAEVLEAQGAIEVESLLRNDRDEWKARSERLHASFVQAMRVASDASKELEKVKAQRDELQARMTEMVDASLERRVRAFHLKYGHPVRTTPTILGEEEVRFRARLVTEEYLELLTALGFDVEKYETSSHYGAGCIYVADQLRTLLEEDPLRPADLVECADALADLAYVVEGTAATLGVRMGPVLDEVQRANMSKGENGPDGKPTKPEGWKPPDVRRVLEDQGWRG